MENPRSVDIFMPLSSLHLNPPAGEGGLVNGFRERHVPHALLEGGQRDRHPRPNRVDEVLLDAPAAALEAVGRAICKYAACVRPKSLRSSQLSCSIPRLSTLRACAQVRA